MMDDYSVGSAYDEGEQPFKWTILICIPVLILNSILEELMILVLLLLNAIGVIDLST